MLALNDAENGDAPVRQEASRLRLLTLVSMAAALAAFAVASALWIRIDRIAVEFPSSSQPGVTYLLVGSDSRQGMDAAESPEFGSPKLVPGERADVVLLIRQERSETHVLALPRDLLVLVGEQGQTRLALTYLQGPQVMVDSICESLGIGVDHMAVIHFDGLRQVVDSIGGIELDMPVPVRDANSGLNINESGKQLLDGDSALAYVRSRHKEVLDASGMWVDAETTLSGRSAQAREVMEAIGHRLDINPLSPFTAIRRLWVLTGAVAMDSGSSPLDMRRLAGVLRSISSAEELTLPVAEGGTAIPTAQLQPEAGEVLRQFDGGDHDSCHPGLLDQFE